MFIKLTGKVIAKKNSRKGYVRGNRIMNFPSNAFKKWHQDAMLQLAAQKVPTDKIPFVKEVEVIHYSVLKKDGTPSIRKFDVTNRTESIMDLLVDHGYILDDNWSVTPRVISDYNGGRAESGCDIHITI